MTKGYGDYTDESIEISELNTVTQGELLVGGNPENEELYLRIWLDRNNDGDFFDSDELVLEMSNAFNAFYFELPLELFSDEARRMRVSVSRYDFAEVCAEFYAGETEDFLIYKEETDFEIESLFEGGNSGFIEFTVQPNPSTDYLKPGISDISEAWLTQMFSSEGRLVKDIMTEAGSPNIQY